MYFLRNRPEPDWGPKSERRGGPFVGTRAAVLELGAKWIRENDARNHAENVERNLRVLEDIQTARAATEGETG